MTLRTATRTLPADGRARLRLAGAMTVSLLVHAIIISLQFGIPGIGLPGLELPWRERRAQTVDLHVVLAPPPAPALPSSESPPPAPASAAESVPPSGLRLVPLPPAPKKKATRKNLTAKAAAPRPPRARIKRETPVIALNDDRESRFNLPPPAPDEVPQPPEPETGTPPAPPAEPAARADEDAAAHEREQAALREAEEATLRAREAEEQAARQQQLAEAARRQEEADRQRALALEAQRIETQRIEEARRREEAERLALELEERRKAEEASRQAAALALQKQREDIQRREREEAARRALELEEKQRVEAQRLQAERMQREAMELQARKQAEAAEAARAAEAAEAARQQAAARERERQAEELAARRKAEAEAAAGASRRDREPELMLGDSPAPGSRIDALPRGLAGGGLAGRALEQARRGDALRSDAPAARQSESMPEQPRRRSILGSKDVDVGVMMYVESWRLKIERNGSIMYPRAAAELAHRDPVVTVAVRSDGSVEGVTIHQGSGQQALDDAVHRIVRVNGRYSAFPPELARRYDVLEIRRVWNFEDRLRILEEVR